MKKCTAIVRCIFKPFGNFTNQYCDLAFGFLCRFGALFAYIRPLGKL